MKTEYATVKLPQNTLAGATVTSLSARQGTTLVRVTEEGRDDLVVTQANNPRKSFEIAWSQVKGGVRLTAATVPSQNKGVRLPDAEGTPDPEPEPGDDTVRLTKKKAAK